MNSYDLSPAAAAAYDAKKVPAIFAPIAVASLERINLNGVHDILDVACGSGIVVRELAARAPDAKRIVGADLSRAMIDVAKSKTVADHVDWLVAPADAMPLKDASFDLVTCQQGLQFFPDKPAALAECRRVLRAGGRLMLTCWAGTPPLFAAIADRLADQLSEAAARTAVAPFAFSDADHISDLITRAGFKVTSVARLDVIRSLPAEVASIATEMLASPNEALLRQMPEGAFDAMATSVFDSLAKFRNGERLETPQSSWLFIATAS